MSGLHGPLGEHVQLRAVGDREEDSVDVIALLLKVVDALVLGQTRTQNHVTLMLVQVSFTVVDADQRGVSD